MYKTSNSYHRWTVYNNDGQVNKLSCYECVFVCENSNGNDILKSNL